MVFSGHSGLKTGRHDITEILLKLALNTIYVTLTLTLSIFKVHVRINYNAGADPGFQVRGGGALKKIAPSGGRRENIWGIPCEKSRFYAKKSYFSQF